MNVEPRSAGGAVRRAGARAAVMGAAALLPAGAAHASVIGVGNAVFGNTCTSQGAVRTAGSTVTGSGVASGNQTGLPLDLPRNHCGNSGIVCTAVFRSSV
ncbi:chaplin family protein [Streptomyces sp. MBT27]|uniref:chaplin family protein n=1 Tax=Streptomyces sp. MBT27 TaxID=1488356 RepID=UPI00142125BF|nr:chaplin family protein [Streptomyces sp. MBT27]